MWARVVEVMLGCWLALSPFIFSHPPEQTVWWVNDLGGAALLATISLATFWPPLRQLHLANLLIGAWLVGYAWWAGYPSPPAMQNELLVGLLVLMFALIPSHADVPPREWLEFYREQHNKSSRDAS